MESKKKENSKRKEQKNQHKNLCTLVTMLESLYNALLKILELKF